MRYFEKYGHIIVLRHVKVGKQDLVRSMDEGKIDISFGATLGTDHFIGNSSCSSVLHIKNTDDGSHDNCFQFKIGR